MKTLQNTFNNIMAQLNNGTWTVKTVHIAPELSSEMKNLNKEYDAAKAVLMTTKKQAKAARKSLSKAKTLKPNEKRTQNAINEQIARCKEIVQTADTEVLKQQSVVFKVQQELINLKKKESEKEVKNYPQKLRAKQDRKAKARNKKATQILRAKEVLFTTRKEEVRNKGIEILNKQGKVICKLRNQITQIKSVSSVKGDLTKCSSLTVQQLERMLSAAQAAYKTLVVSVKQTQALLDSQASNVDIVLNRLTKLVSAA